MWDAFLDALIDTAKMLPILYLVYLLVSFFSHDNNKKYSKFLKKTNRFGPFVGGALGIVPQCGFSSVMADLYGKKIISLGTLMAVFLATSDEAIPIMISKPEFIVPMLVLIGIKFVSANVFGFIIDGVLCLVRRRKKKFVKVDASLSLSHDHVHEHSHEACELHKEEEHCCADNIFVDALKHTLNIVIIVFIATFLINLLVEFVGMDKLASFFGISLILQVLLAGVIGLIPNCAASVLLIELYMSGVLSFAALVAGLSVGAGVGLLVLFAKNKKKIWENLLITFLLYALGVITGLVVSLFNITFV